MAGFYFGKEKKMKTMYIMIGVSGSGKTTYVKEHKKFRDEIVSVDKMKEEYFGTVGADVKKDELFWNEFVNRIDDLLSTDEDVWIDANNLYLSDRKELNRIAKNHQYQVVAMLMNKELNDLLIDAKLPEHKIINQYFSLEHPIKGVDVDHIQEVSFF